MENLKESAYPLIQWETAENGTPAMFSKGGFTKLELASLMIAQGFMADPHYPASPQNVAEDSVCIATAILNIANK